MIFSSIYPTPMRLDRFLRSLWKHIPQSCIEKACRQKLIRVNDKKCAPKTRIHQKDMINLPEQIIPIDKNNIDHFSTNIHQNHTDLFLSMVVFDAPDFCIIHKPYGLPSQGGPGITKSVDQLAGDGYWIVHRLDRHTEGLMVLAKNRASAQKFGEMFKQRTIEKYYLAIVRGHFEKDHGTIDLPLKNIKENGDDKMIVDPTGQKSITIYHTIKVLNKHHTLVVVKPLTGRKHQIRVHLAALGTPILGDMKYGKRAERMHLYAYKIQWPNFTYCLPLERLPYITENLTEILGSIGICMAHC